MSLFTKLLLGLLAVVVLGLAAVYLFFPTDAVKRLVIEQGSAQLGRPVSVGDVSVSLWGGLGATVKQISVASPTDITAHDLIAIDEVDVKLAFWPLLRGSYQINSLVITSPTIHLHTIADGRNNFSFPQPDQTVSTPDTAGASLPLFHFDQLVLTNGRIEMVNDSTSSATTVAKCGVNLRMNSTAPGLFRINGSIVADTIVVGSEKQTAFGPLRADLSVLYDLAKSQLQIDSLLAQMGGLRCAVAGEVSGLTTNMKAALALTLPETELSSLIAALPSAQQAQFADYTLAGTVGCKARILYDSLARPALSYSGSAEFVSLSIGAPQIDGKLTIEKLATTFSTDTLQSTIQGGMYAGQPLDGNVTVIGFADPFIDAALRGQINLALLQPWLPVQDSASISGNSRFDLVIAGKPSLPEELKLSGSVEISNAAFNNRSLPEPIKAMHLSATLSPEAIVFKSLALEFPSSDISMTGTLSRPFPYLLPLGSVDRTDAKPPFFTFALSSRRFNTDKLFPEVVPDPALRAAAPSDSISGIMLPDIDGAGTFAIDSLVYCAVDFTRLKGDISIADRVIDCKNVNGLVYTGSVSGTTAIDLNNFDNPKYRGTFTASKIEANDFVNRFSTFSGIVFGKLDLTGSYAAAGWEPAQLMQSLTLDGLSNLREGKIVTSGPAFEALNGLAGKIGKEIKAEQAVRELAAKLAVEDGKVVMRDLKLSAGSLGDLTLDGFYGFDGSMGYQGNLLLSEESSSKLTSQGGIVGGLTGLLKGKEIGRISLPLKAEGTLTSPKITFDYAAVGKAAVKGLVSDSLSGLKNLLKKKP